jgi:hypothetical protein
MVFIEGGINSRTGDLKTRYYFLHKCGVLRDVKLGVN